MTRAAKAPGAAPSLPQLSPSQRPHPPPSPLHPAPFRGCIAQAPSRRDRGWRRICSRADAPRRQRAPHSAPSSSTRRPRQVELYARHGCEVWAREGRSSSGGCEGRPQGAHRTFSRGHTQADRTVQVSGLGATLPAPSGVAGSARAASGSRTVCSSPAEEGCPRPGAEWRRTHSEEGESIWQTPDSTGLDRMSDLLGRRVRGV